MCGQPIDARRPAGFIKLEMPVFHIGYFRSALQILACICKTCSAVLLDEDIAQRHRRMFRRPGCAFWHRPALPINNVSIAP